MNKERILSDSKGRKDASEGNNNHLPQIPSEIHSFFSIEEGQTLLVKGLPGTGKTTLALEIMSALCEKKNGMYISTRVDPKRLYSTFPWIKEIVPPKNAVNATQSKIIKSLEGIGQGKSTYNSVMDFFRVFFDEAEEMDNPMIVIDSWDALMNYTQSLLGQSQQSFEQNMCEFARDLGIHLIFVSEYANLMPLDYIVDGVVTMEHVRLTGGSSAQLDGWTSSMRSRTAREIRLEKLRSVEIRQRTYTCTLHGGRFNYFEPYRNEPDALAGRDVVRVPDPAKECISTGIPDLDGIIQGMQFGSCNVIEIDHGVGKRYYQILTAMASNALKNGRGVFILPSIGYQLNPKNIFVPTNVSVFPAEGDDVRAWGHELIKNGDQLRERTGRPILNLIGMDAMEFAFGYEVMLNTANLLMRRWKETNDVNVLIVKSGQKSIDMAIHAADRYIVVNELNGGLCLYGVIPRTQPYNMTLTDENRIDLTPIV